MRVAVVGAGLMGRNIARAFLAAGTPVSLYSRSESTVRAAVRSLADHDGAELVAGTRLDSAVAGAGLVLESVPESLALKLEVLAAVEAAAPGDAVIGTNTSSLPLEQLSGALTRPERFLGVHWFNPAHLIPLVEVVPAPSTDAAVLDWTVGILAAAGKRPRALGRALPGFVANRLQYALIREALQLIDDGVADADTIDAALTDCLGLRWAVLGPMRSTDLAGVETAIAVAAELYPRLSTATAPQRPLLELREQGRLGARSGRGFHDYPDPDAAAAERDAALGAVLEALQTLR
jgi:3-hydroxybutyryl-CoA dehydrogenase